MYMYTHTHIPIYVLFKQIQCKTLYLLIFSILYFVLST